LTSLSSYSYPFSSFLLRILLLFRIHLLRLLFLRIFLRLVFRIPLLSLLFPLLLLRILLCLLFVFFFFFRTELSAMFDVFLFKVNQHAFLSQCADCLLFLFLNPLSF
jgi:hypothetical protein